jgi:sugar phosphate isomerase/epimerase
VKLAFSTLGCPDWDLEKIAQAAREYGYEGVELRALGGELDLLTRPEFQREQVSSTRAWLADQGLNICCVDTSCRFDSKDVEERRSNVEVAVRHTELAAALGASLIRIFPDKIQPGLTRDETRDNIAACLREVAQLGIGNVRIALETHGDFARGSDAAEIMRIVDDPKVVLIWDVANSMASGDSIAKATRAVAPYLAHVHLRDARAVDGQEHWLPVLAGRGQVPFVETVEALRRLQFDGYLSFEWEKYWHPEIEEPEVALPDFANAIKKVFEGSAENDRLTALAPGQ